MRQYFPLFVGLCFLSLLVIINLLLFPCAVKRRPKLKSKYQGRVEKAIQYAEAIESWEDLVDPFAYVLRLIEIEGKKSKS